MKAAYIEKFGGPEVLTYGDLPDPVAGPGQVVVDTVAASVNGADPKVAAGEYKQTKFPLILGRDFSGKVSAVGAGVSDLKVGDEVFGVLETGRDGTYCEKIAVGADVVGKKPAGAVACRRRGDGADRPHRDLRGRGHAEAQGRRDHPDPGRGGRRRGLRHPARQASSARASSAPASTGNLDYVRGLGADEVIDYKTTDFTKVVKNCDAVFETVGDDVATALLRGPQAGRPRDLHRLRRDGAQARPQRRDRAAAGRAARAQVHGADRRALRQGRRPPAACHAVRAGEGARGAAASARRVTSRASWCSRFGTVTTALEEESSESRISSASATWAAPCAATSSSAATTR